MLALIQKKAIPIAVGLPIALSIYTINAIVVAQPSIQTQIVYDSYSPAGYDREIRGWNNYRKIWEKYIPIDFPGWKIIDLDITRLETQGDYGWSAISYIGRGVRNGAEYFGGQHGTHIRKHINGDWRIVHEHLTQMSDREVQDKRCQSNITN